MWQLLKFITMIISPASYRLLLLLLMTLLSGVLHGRAVKVASIPIELAGSYIIINTTINNSTPLRLMFDTGVRNTIITELRAADSVDLKPGILKSIQGLGSGRMVSSYVSENNIIQYGKFTLTGKTVYLLEEDILGLSHHIGLNVNGIAGIDLIRDYITEIDYTRKRMNLYRHEHFQIPKRYIYKPLIVENSKLYISLTLLDDSAHIRNIKMLLDTGAMLNAWFQTVRSDAAEIPERRVYARIGEGFSGELRGYMARIPQLCFDKYCFHKPVVVFPDSATISGIISRSDRDGTIGNELLSRFNLIVDIRNKALYLKPNHKFNDRFSYNVAGIEVIQSDGILPVYEIATIWKDSPAEKAGLQTGDVLIEIKGFKTFTLKLSEIRGFFQQISGQPLHVVVNRNQELMDFHVDMRDLLNNP